MFKPDYRQLQAARVRQSQDGRIAVKPAWTTGDPERPWLVTSMTPDGRAVVLLLTESDVHGWTPMLPVAMLEDDELDPEVTW